jgi:ribonuclease P protein component
MRHRRPRLSKSADFDRVYRQGRSVASRHLVLYAFPRTPGPVSGEGDEAAARLGVSVGRRVGGAVERNRVKRVLREAFWSLADSLDDASDYVVVARRGSAAAAEADGLEALRGDLEGLLRRLSNEGGDEGKGEGSEGDEGGRGARGKAA